MNELCVSDVLQENDDVEFGDVARMKSGVFERYCKSDEVDEKAQEEELDSSVAFAEARMLLTSGPV